MPGPHTPQYRSASRSSNAASSSAKALSVSPNAPNTIAAQAGPPRPPGRRPDTGHQIFSFQTYDVQKSYAPFFARAQKPPAKFAALRFRNLDRRHRRTSILPGYYGPSRRYRNTNNVASNHPGDSHVLGKAICLRAEVALRYQFRSSGQLRVRREVGSRGGANWKCMDLRPAAWSRAPRMWR
jgi:hypothetical protein